jgi:Dihydroxybiphenyl dioxygenase BphC D1
MYTTAIPSVFGNVPLGYVVIETDKLSDWKRFGRDAIGMHLDDMAPDTIRFRLDANECRVLLRQGPAEDIVALGWHLDGQRRSTKSVVESSTTGADRRGHRGRRKAARSRAFRAISRSERTRRGNPIPPVPMTNPLTGISRDSGAVRAVV